ncbi:MAG: DUF4153 domain-containing protein [Tannerellaceae bacterium]|jgi:hypothetical protein|nr:DUF4153 domain-containing protein [Tannerellaceae bacterium]
MKKSDFTHIPAQIKQAILRFPVAVLFCVTLFILDCLGIGDYDFSPGDDVLIKANMLLSLGFVAAVGLRLLAQDLKLRGWRGYPDVLLIPLLALYYFLLPERPKDFEDAIFTCYIVFSITAFVLLCVAPYTGSKQPLRFWQYNVEVWWRALFSFIGASVFFGGFALALWSLEVLFDVTMRDVHFLYVATVFYILFAPLFFIAGLPEQSQIAEAPIKNYPFLRVLGQYILLPVLATYLLILYTYGLKILFTWHLPNGWVSWLIIWYSGIGLLIYCMLHNLYVNRESKTVLFFGRAFFYSLLPLIVLLFVALARRISDYGFTEKRYYLLLAACWLTGVSLYMILSKVKSVRWLLISFAGIALLSLVGPWSAFNVSEASQLRRLENTSSTDSLATKAKSMDYVSIYIADEQSLDIAGYDILLKGKYTSWRTRSEVEAKDSLAVYTLKARPEGCLELYHYGSLDQTIDLQALCGSIFASNDSLTGYDHLPEAQLSLVVDGHFKIIFSYIRGQLSPDKETFKLEEAEFDLLRK